MNNNLSDLAEVVMLSSGHRGITLYASYLNSWGLIGTGVGSWSSEIMRSYALTGYEASEIPFFNWAGNGDFVAMRPSSYAANLILEFRVLGWAIIGFIFYRLRACFLVMRDREFFCMNCLFLFHFFVHGAVGNPIPWMALGMVYNMKWHNN
jgi:hypothetical protein